jgi:hypothetical protein
MNDELNNSNPFLGKPGRDLVNSVGLEKAIEINSSACDLLEKYSEEIKYMIGVVFSDLNKADNSEKQVDIISGGIASAFVTGYMAGNKEI